MEDPIQDHVLEAMQHLATSCIEQGWLDEASALLRHLEAKGHAPLTLGLLHVWMLSQAGRTADALAECERLNRHHPESDGVLPLLAVLRYAQGDMSWRGLCERLTESDRTSAEARTMAHSLLAGTFGKTAASNDPVLEAAPPATIDAADFSAMAAFGRA